MGGRFRPDLIVACGIAFLSVGLIFSAIGKVRARSQLLACQENLHTLYNGLAGYADTHDGNYPQIGTNETADSFAKDLVDAGQVPVGFQAGCPAAGPTATPGAVSYTYSLGFQAPNGALTGLRRPPDAADEHDLLPISADYPTASATPNSGPLCPHPPQMNVLFVGGHVRTTTSPLIGPNGDDIYRNIYGYVTAGINQSDVVLGRPGDRP
jgi:prepilin-type processing-associated H-X9-DG protein